VKGILADNDVVGQVDYLVALMRAEPWLEFWQNLGLALFHFEDLGLSRSLTTFNRLRQSEAPADCTFHDGN
jgi:hypothetical protein